jgi:hypothetical protein
MIKGVSGLLRYYKTRRVSVISYLRKKYPGKWTYEPHGHTWHHKDGRYVRRCAAWAPRYEGDDEHYITQYWMYKNEKSFIPVQIYFW